MSNSSQEGMQFFDMYEVVWKFFKYKFLTETRAYVQQYDLD